jgi:hypothetical protein
MRRLNRSILVCLLAFGVTAPAYAQSEHASRASSASLAGLSEVPPATLALLAEGARFSVTALRPVGQSVHVVLSAAADGASFALDLSAEAVATLGLAVGTVVTSTAVSAGWLLQAGAETLAFVPSAAAAALIHHRELQR